MHIKRLMILRLMNAIRSHITGAIKFFLWAIVAVITSVSLAE